MLDPKVVVALDFDKKNDALSFVDKISPTDCKLKVGKEMFTYFGPEFVKTLTGKGFDVFLFPCCSFFASESHAQESESILGHH